MTTTFASTSSPWQPIVTSSDEPHLRDALTSIVAGLTQPTFAGSRGPDLAVGSAGVAAFFSYMQQTALSEGGCCDFASASLSHALSKTYELNPASLFHGTTGIAWALAHLGMPVVRDERTREIVDATLLSAVRRRPWGGPYDLATGLVGYGVYALERLDQPAGSELLKEVVLRLSEIAIRERDGVGWWTPPQLLHGSMRNAYPNGTFNLGVAHGTPGVIALLGQACAAGIAVDRARALLEKAVRWLLKQQRPRTERSSFTRQMVDGKRTPEKWDTLAWCHGDIGVSAALYWAALSVREASWEQEALNLARRAATRAVDDAGIVDASLCHGAAGNGHIFNRFYQSTREEVFLDAARRWFRRVLEFYKPETSISGFPVWAGITPEGTVQWADRPGLLTGAAGVGLALLAATSVVEPNWDRVLLVAIPPRPLSACSS